MHRRFRHSPLFPLGGPGWCGLAAPRGPRDDIAFAHQPLPEGVQPADRAAGARAHPDALVTAVILDNQGVTTRRHRTRDNPVDEKPARPVGDVFGHPSLALDPSGNDLEILTFDGGSAFQTASASSVVGGRNSSSKLADSVRVPRRNGCSRRIFGIPASTCFGRRLLRPSIDEKQGGRRHTEPTLCHKSQKAHRVPSLPVRPSLT